MMHDLILEPREPGIENNGVRKRIYSTSVLPKEVEEDELEELVSSPTPGFIYAATQKNKSNINNQKEHDSKKSHISVLDEKIVKDVIEHSDSSSVSSNSEGFGDFPVEGFPSPQHDWEDRISNVEQKTQTSKKNFTFDKGKLCMPKNIIESSTPSQENYQPTDLVFEFPSGKILNLDSHDSTSVLNVPLLCCSSTSGVICKHKTRKYPNSSLDSPIVTKDLYYTIRDLIVLSRSAVASMRSLALEFLAVIVKNSQTNFYTCDDTNKIEQIISESDAFLCARLALDDSNQSVIQNGLKLLLLFTFSSEEPTLDYFSTSNFVFFSPAALERFCNSYSHSPLNVTDVENENECENLSFGKIASLFKSDIISGLLASEICSRLSYLLSIYSNDMHTKDMHVSDMIIRLLIRIARHSIRATDVILKTDNLFETLSNKFLKVNIELFDTSPKMLTTTNAVKLLRIMASTSPRNTSKIVFNNKVIDIIARFLPLQNDTSTITSQLLILKKEVWLLYAYTLKFDLNNDSLVPYSHLLLTDANLCAIRAHNNTTDDSSTSVPEIYKQQYVSALFQAALAVLEVVPNTDPLFKEILIFFISISKDISSSKNLNLSIPVCDIIKVIFTRMRYESVVEQIKSPTTVVANAIKASLDLISPNSLNNLSNCLTHALAECSDSLRQTLGNVCNITTTPRISRYKYGIGSSEREVLVIKMVDLSKLCREWAVRCRLCGILSKYSPIHEGLHQKLLLWMFSENSLKLLANVSNLDFIVTQLMYNEEPIARFMHGVGESLLEYIKTCKIMKETKGFMTSVKEMEGNFIPLLHKSLIMTMPSIYNDDFKDTGVPNILFDEIYSNPFTGKVIKIKFTSKKCNAILEDMSAGTLYYPPYSVSWPLSALAYIGNNGATSLTDKDDLLKLFYFNELIDAFYSTCNMSNKLQKTWKIIPELSVEKFLLTYNVFVIPSAYYTYSELKNCLSKIMDTTSDILLKSEDPNLLKKVVAKNVNFYNLYTRVIANFKSLSYGDELYAKYLLFMLRKDIPTHYLFSFHEELEDVLFLFESIKGGPISSSYEKDIEMKFYRALEYEEEFWFSYETTNPDLLTLWFKLIAVGLLKKHSFLRAMAVSHISNALFKSEDSKSKLSNDDSTEILVSSELPKSQENGKIIAKEKLVAGACTLSQSENSKRYSILKKQIARFILENEETLPHSIVCDEIFSWKDWPSYYYEKKQPQNICAMRRSILESLLIG